MGQVEKAPTKVKAAVLVHWSRSSFSASSLKGPRTACCQLAWKPMEAADTGPVSIVEVHCIGEAD